MNGLQGVGLSINQTTKRSNLVLHSNKVSSLYQSNETFSHNEKPSQLPKPIRALNQTHIKVDERISSKSIHNSHSTESLHMKSHHNMSKSSKNEESHINQDIRYELHDL